MPIPPPTADEIVEAIKRSTLLTVVVEGGDDVIVYRWMEAILRGSNVDFLPCHTRSIVLEVFRRRTEFSGQRVVFVADRDMWVLDSPPARFADVVFTAGYSIENDVLACECASRLFDSREKASFQSILSVLEEWFSFEAQEYADGRPFVLNVPIRQIVDVPGFTMSPVFIADRGFSPVSGPVRELVRAKPSMLIRGKNLLDAYALVLNSDGRPSKYSKKAILELCVKMPDDHPHCDRLIGEIRRALQI
jgi:hypothetical protein